MGNKILNSYYLYYTSVLKDRNLSEDQLILEMKKRFIDITMIGIRDWGRTTRFQSINIRKDDRVEYIIPLQSPKEMLEYHMTLGERFLKQKWVFPPFITMGTIYRIISENEVEDVDILYKSIYETKYFASQLTSTYRKIKLFSNYLYLIEEAIDCFLLGKNAGAITLLLTIIEGIARDFCESHSLPYNKQGSTSAFETAVRYRKENWRDNFLLFEYQNNLKQIIPDDYMVDEILVKVDEAMDMFVSFEKYGLDYLYKSGSDFTLNRHSILHGFNRDYYISINFFRLFSCLEMLAVVVSNNFMAKDIDDYNETLRILNKFQLLEAIASIDS
ncbi:hypothetical protein [Paenibacillus periandrae]|uniref:hypothetical protein n=1 Tax=Paenibacillus periandrae TaxID=1761741 RepID=UPI001F09F4CC|nr:hypothetical protein [Paenibacillus periandrae]